MHSALVPPLLKKRPNDKGRKKAKTEQGRKSKNPREARKNVM